MFEETVGTIRNEQCRDTGNNRHNRHMTKANKNKTEK